MRLFHRLLVTVALLFWPAPSSFAQTGVDPSGHWEGAVQAPDMTVDIEIDLAKDGKGRLAGTFSQPGQALKGFPLSAIAVEGRTLRFELRPGEGGGSFKGLLSDDGTIFSGDFVMSQGGYTLPFRLKRTGDAQIAPAPRSAPVAKAFEGVWKGALDLGSRQMRVDVTMTNEADGTASGTIMSPDGSGVEIPIAMTQQGSSLTIEVKTVGASFVGTLNAAGTEIAGTWTQGPSALPLTLRR
jgi:hypothetical protein